MASKNLPGYPQSDGGKQESVAAIDGLASYTTGGQLVNASQFGLKFIEHMDVSGSDNAGHTCSARFTGKGPQATAKIVWIVVGTGVEVANAVNLSARSIRVRVQGM